jgi:hypothetical protein
MIPFFFLSLFFALLAAWLVEVLPVRTGGLLKGAVIGMPLGIAIWLLVIGVAWKACK